MAAFPAIIPYAAVGQGLNHALGQGPNQGGNPLPALPLPPLPQVPAAPAAATVTARLTSFTQFYGDESKDHQARYCSNKLSV
jgi:hypothetical protein